MAQWPPVFRAQFQLQMQFQFEVQFFSPALLPQAELIWQTVLKTQSATATGTDPCKLNSPGHDRDSSNVCPSPESFPCALIIHDVAEHSRELTIHLHAASAP